MTMRVRHSGAVDRIIIWCLFSFFLGCAVAGLWQAHRAAVWEAKWEASDSALKTEKQKFTDYYTEAEKAKQQLDAALKESESGRVKSEAEVVKLKSDIEVLRHKLDIALSAIKAMSPTELVNQLTTYVGPEVTLTAANFYLFTRTGAELTLNKFLVGDFNLAQYQKQLSITGEVEKQRDSALADIEKFKTKVALTEGELKTCKDYSDKQDIAYTNLKKAFTLAKWKDMGKGFVGGGVVTVVLLKVFNLIK